MQVNLKESEIGKAVELFLQEQGIKTYGKDVTMQFSMGKGANGLKVQIDIEDNPNFFDELRSGAVKAPELTNSPVRLLPTENNDADETPAKSTVTTLIDKHTKTVAAQAAAEPADKVAFEEERRALAELPGEADVTTAVDVPEAAVAAEEDKGPPFEVEQPDLPAEGVIDINKAEGNSFQVVIEKDTPLGPEPTAKAPRKAIFGKKTVAAAVAEPVAEPVVETEPALAEAADDAGFDLPQEDAPVAEPIAKPGLPRRSVGSLFKKPAA